MADGRQGSPVFIVRSLGPISPHGAVSVKGPVWNGEDLETLCSPYWHINGSY